MDIVPYMCRSDIFCSTSVALRISPVLRCRDGVAVIIVGAAVAAIATVAGVAAFRNAKVYNRYSGSLL